MSLPEKTKKQDNEYIVEKLSNLQIEEGTQQYRVKKYYRAKDVAKYFSIGLSSVWLFAKQGKFKAYKISDKVTVFNIDEVEKALFGGEQ